MAKCCILLVLAVLLGICYGAQSNYIPNSGDPKVEIESVQNMTPNMQLDAVDIMKKALASGSTGDQCSFVRQRFTDKYPDYTWNVVLYRAYSVQYVRSIDLKVGNDHYLLFATKK